MTKDHIEEELKLALEAVEWIAQQRTGGMIQRKATEAITAIKQARSAPLHDAFAQLMRDAEKPISVPESIAKYAAALVAGTHEITSLTIQPKRQWVGLTDEEKRQIFEREDYQGWLDYINAIEAKLRSKNEDRN